MSARDAGSRPATMIELPPSLDLRAAKPLADRLLALRGNAVTLDASQVEKLGSQCVQVLLSAAKTWKADRGDIAVIAPSPAFALGLRTLGLSTDQISTGN